MITMKPIFVLLFAYVIVHCDSTKELLDQFENTLQHVVADNEELQTKLFELQQELKSQEIQKANLLASVIELQKVIQTQKDQITTIENGNMFVEKSPIDDESETKLDRKRQLNAAWVGFTAVISPADITGLGPHQPIIFDKIITNMADAYNPTTGIFTTPAKGIYAFNMDILVEAGENEYLQFVKDGSHVMYNFAHASGSLHDSSSSRTVVLELDVGNQVWVQTAPNSHHGSGTIHGNGFSTYSGWLLAFVEDQSAIVG